VILREKFVSCLQDNQVALACEVLKTLFNLTMHSGEHPSVNEEAEFLRLASILHDFLLCVTQPCEKQYELHRCVIYFNYNTHILNLFLQIHLGNYIFLLHMEQRW
jgi:hypothetical protein